MLVAKAIDHKGQTIILLGVFPENIRRLTAGKPILVSCENHGNAIPDGLKICIAFDQSPEVMLAKMRKHGWVTDETQTECNHVAKGEPACEPCRAIGVGLT